MTEVLECYTERNRKKADFTILLSFCTQFANVNLTSGYLCDIDSELDAAKDYNGNGPGASAFQYSASGGNLVHEDKKPYFQEHSDRTYENILYGFRQDAR